MHKYYYILKENRIAFHNIFLSLSKWDISGARSRSAIYDYQVTCEEGIAIASRRRGEQELQLQLHILHKDEVICHCQSHAGHKDNIFSLAIIATAWQFATDLFAMRQPWSCILLPGDAWRTFLLVLQGLSAAAAEYFYLACVFVWPFLASCCCI